MPGDGDVIEPRVQEDLVPFGPAGGLWDEKTLQEVHALFGDAEGAAGAKIDLQTGVLEVQEELAERILSGGSCGLEGRRAGEHLEEDDADGPEVDAEVVGLGPGELRCQVVGRADKGLGQLAGLELLGEAKVAYLESGEREIGVREHEVGGLEVAVEDVVGVQVAEAVAELPGEPLHDGLGDALWRRPAQLSRGAGLQRRAQLVTEVSSCHVLEHQAQVLGGVLGVHVHFDQRHQVLVLEVALDGDLLGDLLEACLLRQQMDHLDGHLLQGVAGQMGKKDIRKRTLSQLLFKDVR